MITVKATSKCVQNVISSKSCAWVDWSQQHQEQSKAGENRIPWPQLPSMVCGVTAANIDVTQVLNFVAAHVTSIRVTSVKLMTSLTSVVAYMQVSATCRRTTQSWQCRYIYSKLRGFSFSWGSISGSIAVKSRKPRLKSIYCSTLHHRRLHCLNFLMPD